MKLTITDFARMGGRARWKGISKKKRSEMMKKIRAQQNAFQGASEKPTK